MLSREFTSSYWNRCLHRQMWVTWVFHRRLHSTVLVALAHRQRQSQPRRYASPARPQTCPDLRANKESMTQCVSALARHHQFDIGTRTVAVFEATCS